MPSPINVIIDLSHHQETVDFKKIKNAGVVGVIHKAVEGLTFIDEKYSQRKQAALDAGLLWGAYHFGVGGDGSDQAVFFLNTVNPEAETLLVLDYEPHLTGPTSVELLSLDRAIQRPQTAKHSANLQHMDLLAVHRRRTW